MTERLAKSYKAFKGMEAKRAFRLVFCFVVGLGGPGGGFGAPGGGFFTVFLAPVAAVALPLLLPVLKPPPGPPKPPPGPPKTPPGPPFVF